MLTTIDSFFSIVLVMVLYRWAKQHRLLVKPFLFHAANILFLLGMIPWLDVMARDSIWLHSIQSVMVHHMAPLLWIMSLRHTAASSSTQAPGWKITLFLTSFALLTWTWMLPSIHPLLMQSALIYSVMKWLMALSGLALCLTMLNRPSHSQYWQRLNLLTVTLPLMFWGVMMIVIPDMYQSAHSSMHHHHAMMSHVPEWLQLQPSQDQFLGGIIFILAGYFYWRKETSSEGLSGHTRCVSE